MLSGNDRVACQRIPAHKLMYSTSEWGRGQLCGQIQDIILKVSKEVIGWENTCICTTETWQILDPAHSLFEIDHEFVFFRLQKFV